MQDFINKKIVLGVCGGISAYKVAFLIRDLRRLGAEIRVVMTKSAQAFISPLSLQALSGNEVRTELFDAKAENGMGHIELARLADFLVVAPASANTIAKFAHGLADDLLSTLYLATNAPILLCPAMNKHMWEHPANLKNCDLLRERGVVFIGPDVGEQACGDYGLGRLSQIDSIINALRLFPIKGLLKGKKLMITAGPTREAIDPVRFISNRSSGRMAYALAEAAKTAQAEVILITGPTELTPPSQIECHRVNTAKEMHQAVMTYFETGMIFIACAAVADYAPVPQKHKIKKQKTALSLKLLPTVDILAELAASKKAAYLMGFAAETDELILHAKAKLEAKELDMIVANQVGDGLGFESENNQVTVITKSQTIEIKLMNKVCLAAKLIAILATNLQNAPFKV